LKPSIYILRKNSDPLPARDTCALGDIVILPSGDVLVYVGNMWDLLPGRYVSVDELKEFISYVSSGWPESQDTAKTDLEGRLPKQFLDRMLSTVEKLSCPGQT
jgi:hypothetical protein